MTKPYMTLENQSLKMVFPQETAHTKCEIEIRFHRTLRIPDDNKKYSLPPDLGKFPLHHVDDFAQNLPAQWKEHGGIFMPMHQAEAMWVSFHSKWPFAVKLASGKINAVSGEAWTPELKNAPNEQFNHFSNFLERERQLQNGYKTPVKSVEAEQDYMVVPSQPWLDGFNVGKGVIRQFVAVPLNSGYTVEEQLTGSAEHGGLQIMVYPMKKSEFLKIEQPPMRAMRGITASAASFSLNSSKGMSDSVSLSAADMGMGAGGFMKQEIISDQYGFDKWDTTQSQRVFVHLLNSLQYRHVTGKDNPTPPLTPKEYSRYNYPWFEYYTEGKALSGSDKLAKVDSIASMDIKNDTNMLGDNSSVQISTPHMIGPKTIKNGKW